MLKSQDLLGRGGYTLIELVIGLSIISIAMPSSMVVFPQVLQSKFVAESRIQAANLALGVMERTLRKRFSDVQSVPLTSCTQDHGANFANYTYQITVTGANPNNLDEDCATFGTCHSDYKRVVVKVSNARTANSVWLVSVVTNTP